MKERIISEYSISIKKSKKQYEEIQAMLSVMLQELNVVYSNKSSDEYKHAGDITRSTEYNRIESRIADLSTLINFRKEDIKEIKTLFSTLHRPIFKQMVTEYINEPNDQNIFYTALYTVGYRVLIGELSRIFASTIIDSKKRMVYKPDKISRDESMDKFIKLFNLELDKAINEFVKMKKGAEMKQESALSDAAVPIWNDAKKGIKVIGMTLMRFAVGIATGKFNPIVLAGTILSGAYTKKVRNFDKICAQYEEAKIALAEYQKKPLEKQDQAIIKKYEKLIDKYNIKMQNLKAKIAHYDQRAKAESEYNQEQKKAAIEDETSTTQKRDSSSNDDETDFDF